MDPNTTWTLIGLIKAFVDLLVAYVLLCGAFFVFLVSKFLSLLGLSFLCPCNGLFGLRNSSLFWHKLLLDFPVEKIHHVKILVQSRFPFAMVQNGTKFHEPEGEVCSSSVPTLMSPRSNYKKENGFDPKGKKFINQKRKSGFRWRRKATLDSAKVFPLSSSDDSQLLSATPECSSNRGRMINEVDSNWETTAARGGDISQCSIELGKSFDDSESIDKASFCSTISCRDWKGKIGNEKDIIKMLEEELQQERAARNALCLELEKERAAAAIAAEQAMAMILRLQEDKASLAMEARQYQRIIEEKVAYEEEEMETLREILLMRDVENYSLEKKLEAFRQMSNIHKEQLEVDPSIWMRKGGDQNSNVKKLQEREVSNYSQNNIVDKESIVYDVYTVDEKTESLEGRVKECEPTTFAASNEAADSVSTCMVSGFQNGNNA